jgi:hypothetical protein
VGQKHPWGKLQRKKKSREEREEKILECKWEMGEEGYKRKHTRKR